MHLLSVNVATPQTLEYGGKTFKSSIFKKPVATPIAVGFEDIEGNQQSSLDVHGGCDMAVYAYGANHYDHWCEVLGVDHLDYGALGETMTFSEIDETDLCLGDQLQINDVILAVTQFRVPCFKFGAKFDRPDLPQLFTQYAYTGAYFKVLKTGTVTNGDPVNIIKKHPAGIRLKAVFEAYYKPKTHGNKTLLARAAKVDDVSDEWQDKFAKRALTKT